MVNYENNSFLKKVGFAGASEIFSGDCKIQKS